MDGILLEETEQSYYVNLREFASGAFEAIVKTVRPMQREEMKRQFEEFGGAGAPVRVKSDDEKPDDGGYDRMMNHKRAVRRAKQNIRWQCKVMEADRLFTLNYRNSPWTDDPMWWHCRDRDQVKADFKEFLRLVRKRFPKWGYVAVLERTQRGAFHIHCAVKGWQYIDFLRQCWHKALGAGDTVYGKGSPGNVDVTSPKEKRWGAVSRQWKTERLAGYITKYISKTFDETTTEKRRYWHSKELKVPEKSRFWLRAQNIVDAIYEVRELLRWHCGMVYGADMWISDLEDCFWIAGRGS